MGKLDLRCRAGSKVPGGDRHDWRCNVMTTNGIVCFCECCGKARVVFFRRAAKLSLTAISKDIAQL
jgi:hypothetical protein